MIGAAVTLRPLRPEDVDIETAFVEGLSVESRASRLLESSGLRRQHWEDVSAKSLAWFRTLLERFAARGRPPLGLHLLMGADAPQKFDNLVRNLAEARIVVVQAVYEKK